MEPEEAYRRLVENADSSTFDDFDVHVAAAIIALALSEAGPDGRTLCDCVGLDGRDLVMLVAEMFPGALVDFEECAALATTIDEEERSLRDILWMYSTGATRLQRHLTAMIARRCGRPHHLWQDLGLNDRSELSRLMKRHFARLAEKNEHDMKWKKFLYRLVCRSEGFTLCSAPVCSECDDFSACFGAEDGEALLARLRNGREAIA